MGQQRILTCPGSQGMQLGVGHLLCPFLCGDLGVPLSVRLGLSILQVMICTDR